MSIAPLAVSLVPTAVFNASLIVADAAVNEKTTVPLFAVMAASCVVLMAVVQATRKFQQLCDQITSLEKRFDQLNCIRQGECPDRK